MVPSNAGERLVLFDLELATQAPKQLFAEWLADVISEAAVNAEGLIPKSKKRRYVQFTFSAHNEGDVFAAFGDAAEVRQLSSWEAEETSAAGVKTAQRRFVLSDELLCGLAGLHHGADVAAAAQERGADGGAHMDPLNVRSRHQSLHHFVADANWSDEQMLLGVCQWVVPLMDFSNGGWWIIDDTGFPKSGPRATKSR